VADWRPLSENHWNHLAPNVRNVTHWQSYV